MRDGRDICIVLINGSIGLTGAGIAAMSKLELACALGTGHENTDAEAVRARGMAVTNGTGTDGVCVANRALGLLLVTVCGISKLDHLTRNGIWHDDIPLQPSVHGKHLDVADLSTVGMQIARRAAGFNMQIAYHNRKLHEGVLYRYFDALKDTASWANPLIVATSGGA